MAATGQVSGEVLEGAIFIGELSLDGAVRPVNGALPIAVGTRERGIRKRYIPVANAREAAIVSDLDVFPVSSLADVVRRLEPRDTSLLDGAEAAYQPDFAEPKGYASARLAFGAAATGGHDVLLVGSPFSSLDSRPEPTTAC